MNILELYSGIGGMHMALLESGLKGKIKAAIEINNIANTIYKHNFPKTSLLNLNIEGLTEERIKKLNVNTILMSPPCQPFTRNGNQKDVNDSRTDSFRHILSLLPNLDNIENILIENVKGFESSKMRDYLVQVLTDCHYTYQEFILSPSQFSLPNCRHRYYCLGKKQPNNFKFETDNAVMDSIPSFPSNSGIKINIGDILEDLVDFESYCLSHSILKKRIHILDICYPESDMSCCFTKAYGRYIEGTGSVVTTNNKRFVEEQLEKLKKQSLDEEEYMDIANSLQLRFFTPREICRLMCFPETFTFPSSVSKKQRYMVLGNSVNVKVVSYLIKLLQNYLSIMITRDRQNCYLVRSVTVIFIILKLLLHFT